MKFSIIYTDPCWSYANRHEIRKDGKRTSFGIGVSTRYTGGCMSTTDLCALPVQDIADRNCAFLMWATPPTLTDAIRCIEAYGFRYVTVAFTWVKTNLRSKTPWFGIGSYTKSNAEVCLLAMKGSLPRLSHKVSQIIMQPHVRKDGKIWHSAKPPIVRDKIVEVFGDLPRIELFARTPTPGWYHTGLETDGKDIKEVLPKIANNEYIPPMGEMV